MKDQVEDHDGGQEKKSPATFGKPPGQKQEGQTGPGDRSAVEFLAQTPKQGHPQETGGDVLVGKSSLAGDGGVHEKGNPEAVPDRGENEPEGGHQRRPVKYPFKPGEKLGPCPDRKSTRLN